MSTALQLLLLKALASSPGLAVSDAALTLLVMILNVGVYVGLVHFLAVRRGALTWRDIARPARLAPDPSDPPQAPARYPAAAARPRFFRLPVDVLAGAVLVIPALIATGFVVRTLMILLRLKESDVSSPVPTVFSVDERWFVFVAVAILAPIGEEVFFRGFATNAWARSLSRPNALVRAGLFFAFIHIIDVGSGSGDLILRTSIVAFATRLPVSFALSWLYVSRRSIYASAALVVAPRPLATG
jgi:membrane protease YdiL (CAAX protease family)